MHPTGEPQPATNADKQWWDYDATQLRSTLETIFGKPASRMPEPPQPATNADEPVSGKAIAGLVVLVFFVLGILAFNPKAIGFLAVIGFPIVVVVVVVGLIYKVFQMMK
jgi:hypothetical protein